MRDITKDAFFKKIMETRLEFMDTKGLVWKEATELAVKKRKLLLDKRLRDLRFPTQPKSKLNISMKMFLKDHVLNAFYLLMTTETE